MANAKDSFLQHQSLAITVGSTRGPPTTAAYTGFLWLVGEMERTRFARGLTHQHAFQA